MKWVVRSGSVILYCLCSVMQSVLPANSQNITRDTLESVMVSVHDLTGLAGTNAATGAWEKRTVGPFSDRAGLNLDMAIVNAGRTGAGTKGIVSYLRRGLDYQNRADSEEGASYLEIWVVLCDSPDTALDQLNSLSQSSTPYQTGSFQAADPLGDVSRFIRFEPHHSLFIQCGNTAIRIGGTGATQIRRKQRPNLPCDTLEAVAHLMLLKAGKLPEQTGIAPSLPTILINGKTLPAGKARRIAGRVYVPVAEFAQAAGIRASWNRPRCELTLFPPSGGAYLLRFGSAEAEDGDRRVRLKVPLLREGEQAVMELSDLAALMGGRVTTQGNTYGIRW
jgi:hypothetical protein